jgi:hypothetical protein
MYIFCGTFFQLSRILNDIFFGRLVPTLFTLKKRKTNSQKNEEISPDLFHLCEPELYIYSDPVSGFDRLYEFQWA